MNALTQWGQKKTVCYGSNAPKSIVLIAALTSDMHSMAARYPPVCLIA